MGAIDLIRKYGVKTATFTVELMTVNAETGKPEIDTLIVRQIKSTQELTEIKVKAGKFFRMCETNPPPAYKPFLPVDEQTADMVVSVAELVTDPPISYVEALQMASEAGQLLAHIYGQIMARNIRAGGVAEMEAIEEAKKLLQANPSTEAILPSGETASTNTLNSSVTPNGAGPETGTL